MGFLQGFLILCITMEMLLLASRQNMNNHLEVKNQMLSKRMLQKETHQQILKLSPTILKLRWMARALLIKRPEAWIKVVVGLKQDFSTIVGVRTHACLVLLALPLRMKRKNR